MRRLTDRFLGLDNQSSTVIAGRAARVGVFSSAVSLIIVASWMALVSSSLNIISIAFASVGVFVLASSLKKDLTLAQANLVALSGHLLALLTFYVFYTRMVNVTYVTDAIVGTYMGVLKVLQGQNPYA